MRCMEAKNTSNQAFCNSFEAHLHTDGYVGSTFVANENHYNHKGAKDQRAANNVWRQINESDPDIYLKAAMEGSF